MARDYLLDTNILRYWYDAACPEHVNVRSHVQALRHSEREPTLFVSSITIGEIEYGFRANNNSSPEDYFTFIDEQLSILDVRRSTAIEYGSLRAKLFEQFAPKNGRKKRRLEQLFDPLTATSLGIQENDLWIAAQAIEYDLILVTHDAMVNIKKCAGGQLSVDDWAKTPV